MAARIDAQTPAPADELVFGVILVGAQDDQGWSQAHYEGGLQAEIALSGTRMLVYEGLNPTDSPNVTLGGVVGSMVSQGARVIFTTSDTFEGDTNLVAAQFPDVAFVMISGDDVLTGEAPPNVSNIFAQMEWGKMIAGCAAALMTETGQIGYLGPLINDETRRFAASAHLGARHCFERFRQRPIEELTFSVTWIGFWFNIPGQTLDPSVVAREFFDSGADVVISGIDTNEALRVAGERTEAGDRVFAVPYNYNDACSLAPAACLGVNYFQWDSVYIDVLEQVQAGTWRQQWSWLPPDWRVVNQQFAEDLAGLTADDGELVLSTVNFRPGQGLTGNAAARLQSFTLDLTRYDTNPFVPQSFALWTGPLRFQDGSLLADDNQFVDVLDVWYLPQLLEGMIGASE
jgi:simple sugar transport system substrate-binding protein